VTRDITNIHPIRVRVLVRLRDDQTRASIEPRSCLQGHSYQDTVNICDNSRSVYRPHLHLSLLYTLVLAGGLFLIQAPFTPAISNDTYLLINGKDSYSSFLCDDLFISFSAYISGASKTASSWRIPFPMSERRFFGMTM